MSDIKKNIAQRLNMRTIRSMVETTFKVLDAKEDPNRNKEELGPLVLMFLQAYCDALASRALRVATKDQLTDEEKYKKTIRSFMTGKTHVQEAIAKGFEDAMMRFANNGQQIEYFVTIKSYDSRPVNKEDI